MSKENFKEILQKLIDTFERNKDVYKDRHSAFNEAQLREQFVNPMFKALGWDMNNEEGYAEQYKEVVHEDKVIIKGKPKAPDYSFRIGGQRKFFLEAKQPFVKIKTDYDPALQIRRYAWSAHLPISILTDFEEFAIYDTTIEPKADDNASIARIEYFTFDQYLDNWEKIYNLFAKDSILKGSFDKYAAKEKRGKQAVDKVFLKELERWRELLAKDIAKNNDDLSVEDLNFSVQKLIDRIIFLRIAEDRGIEEYKNLENLIKHDNSYSQLTKHFYSAHDKYNSSLFDFDEDKLTPKLKVSDKILDTILSGLYYPNSPYEFSVLGVELLGSIYEQFLGKVIRLTSGHNAKVEDKPEVKKAGGVYYTPQYIVEYIVKNTVGELVKDKTPKQVAKITILDPACGSGSFLIGAYEFLLDWHLDYYTALSDKEKEKLEKNGVIYRMDSNDPSGDNIVSWHLTTAEKKKIMLNNIYGVDIDSQAVEVTKLSLALKMLENENHESITKQMKLIPDRILPDLSSNIKCGNSLVGSDFYDSFPIQELDKEIIKKINVFDWQREFQEVFNKGGFDVVIGNPPYLRIQGLQENNNEQIEYFQKRYLSAVKRFDLYLLFLELGFGLLKKNGVLSYINPHKFTNGDFGSGLRSFFIDKNALESITSFGSYLVFENATTYTAIIKLSNKSNNEFGYIELSEKNERDVKNKLNDLSGKDLSYYNVSELDSDPWSLMNKVSKDILDKLNNQECTISQKFAEIMVGIQSGIDSIHILEFRKELDNELLLFSNEAKQEIIIEKDLLVPLLMGEDVHKYEDVRPNHYCIYPYKLLNEKTTIYEEDELKELYPKGFQYLNQYKNKLKAIRERQKTNAKYWYSCHRQRNITVFESERIITPEISLGCNMTIGEPGIYHNTKVYSLIPDKKSKEDLFYWLGVLNSPVLWWFLKQTGYVLRGGYYVFKTNYLKPFPVKNIDFKDKIESKAHDYIVHCVRRILEIKKKLSSSDDSVKRILNDQLSKLETEVNQTVYGLYDLTKKEIDVIEGSL